MATAYTPKVTGDGIRARIQRVGGHLAGMVMPNIGAFIAWGLITALFIPTGWVPNAELAELVDPMIKFLLPILIGYTGGRMVHGQRGAVVGAVATVGVIVGAEMPMFLGAMIIGPLAAYLMKLLDGLLEDRIRPGFEMLVDNFSAGILAGAMALAGRSVIGPVMSTCTDAAGDAVSWLIDHDLLPVASVLIEPAKVLFLNNAINHGVLGPLAVQQAAEHGKSILFTLESNPGPGLGVLLAYMFFGPRRLRPSTPAAIIIHLFGGIHEIYFPYILMKPRMILAAVAGGATGVAIFLAFGTGLVATPSPGSIFAYLAQTPKGASNWIGIYAGVLASAGVSFGVGAALLGFGRLADPDAEPGGDAPQEEAAAPGTENEPAAK
ncbi:PTS mannitol transporter subunit IICB [Actinomadura xylanilytica]|uniref:PTS mannitol transporter subunit IICB n=1 Tax=Actinomadura xylanilytica TaxID=887459 RepID=UPI00255AA7FC|nr:PTS mannitol transporter subunit IICB [Actinomadura xylanilytica]MDL4771858.1 PTS mannitol transporter subunit IICB [Actinomadura xylanilytica]